jgi:hypothetical protein
MEKKVKNLTIACWVLGLALVGSLAYIGYQVYEQYKAENPA